MTTAPSATNERPGDLYRQLSSAIDRVPFKRTHIIIIFMIGVGALFDAIEQYNVGYAAPFLVKHWGLSTTEVALLTTFTFAGLAVGSVIAGVTGDLYGRRVTYMYNLLLFSVGGFISALAPDYTEGAAEAEIALAWTRPDLERESQDHPGGRVRTATVPDGTRVTVVGRLDGDTLILVTTWRH